jgi:hypothetical protein
MPMKRILLAILLVFNPGIFPHPAALAGAGGAALTDITITTAKGKWPFAVELARSEDERSRGLMFRKSLVANGGMLFVYEQEERLAMWMKNTFIPLDMLFVDRKGRIINIAKNTKPQSLDIIYAKGPALAVLEVAGGTADRLGVVPGDQVGAVFFSNK